MTDKGQRIFKWIVWISLITILFFSVFRWIYKIFNPDISKTEWMALLGSKIDRKYDKGYGDEMVTGKDVAILSMKALGDKRLEYLVDGELTDEKLIKLADDLDIVNKNKLDDTYSQKEAEKVLSDLTNYYSDPETYPVYDKTEYTENVVFTDGWDITTSEEGTTTVASTGYKLEPGKILLIENEYGIAEARKIVTCEAGAGENEYIVTTEDIESLSEVATHFSFSGYADFSHLAEADKSFDVEKNINLFSVAPLTAHAAEIDKSTPKTTLEFGIAFHGETIDHQTKDSLQITVKKDGKELELKNPIIGENITPNYKYSGKEVSLGGTVTIEDLSVVASSEWNPENDEDKNNTVSITVNCNVIFDIAVDGEFTGNIPLFDEPKKVPFNAGGGLSLFSIELMPVLTIGSGGELTMEWEIGNIRKGVEYVPTNNTPLTWINEGDKPAIDFYANVYFDGGVRLEASAYILNKIELADPSIDFKARIKAETQGINTGFEEYPPCVDVGLFVPLVKIEASNILSNREELSALAKVLKKLEINVSCDVVTEDNAPVQINRHIEFEKDGTVNKPISGLAEEVCTHVLAEEDDILSDLENSLDDIKETQKEAAMEAIREKLKEEFKIIVEKLLLDNCG